MTLGTIITLAVAIGCIWISFSTNDIYIGVVVFLAWVYIRYKILKML